MGKTFTNTDAFRQPALHYLEHGYYTNAVEGTKEWEEYWDTQRERSLNGYQVGDTEITGYHYWFMNFSPIQRIPEEGLTGESNVAAKEESFPAFYDGDYTYFWLVDIARNGISKEKYEWLDLKVDIHPEDLEGGRHLVILKARRKGYSYKNASMLSRNYHLLTDSKNYAFADDKEFLLKDGILHPKTWGFLEFINDHTAFGQPRLVDKNMHKYSGYKTKVASGYVERGTKNQIIGISLKNDPEKSRGKDGDLLLFEEAGKLPDLKKSWKVAGETVNQGKFTTGLMIAFGTGGEEGSDFEGLEEMFNNPEAYRIMRIRNQWDDGAHNSYCGFFHPASWNFEGFMDADGNSREDEAIEYIMDQREKAKKAPDPSALSQYVSEQPLCLHPDTWVSWENGISRIGENPDRIDNGMEDLYKITTENNRELILTKTHPIYNGEDYYPLEDYSEGDVVKVLPISFNSEYQSVTLENRVRVLQRDLTIDEDWGKFIGFFIGDGCYYKGSIEISFDKKDESSIEWMRQFMEKNLSTPQLSSNGEGGCRLRCKSKLYSNILKSLDLISMGEHGNHLNKKRQIPDYIFKSPKEVVASFLSGYFDADGTASRRGIVSITSKDENLMDGVVLLLTGFNIYGHYSIHEYINSSGNPYKDRQVRLRKKHNPIFIEEIGFVSTRKQKRVESNLPERKNHQDYSLEAIRNIEYYGRDRVFNLTTKKGYYSANGIWNHNSPQEATTQADINIFPTAELQAQLNSVNANQRWKFGTPGKLYRAEDRVKFNPDDDVKPIYKFPHQPKEDLTGGVVIYQSPYRTTNEEGQEHTPRGMYIVCHDPYAQNTSAEGRSLGAAYVIKRTNNIDPTMNECIVASYVGRPNMQDEYNRNLFLLAEYYNAKIGFENDRGDVIGYAKRFKKLHMLEEQFEMLDKKELQSKNVKRPYGMHMTKPRKEQGEIYIRDWLMTPITNYDDGTQKLVVHSIFDPALLQELIKYNKDGNFDRVMAIMVGMYHQKELYNKQVKETEQAPYRDFFLETSHFK